MSKKIVFINLLRIFVQNKDMLCKNVRKCAKTLFSMKIDIFALQMLFYVLQNQKFLSRVLKNRARYKNFQGGRRVCRRLS